MVGYGNGRWRGKRQEKIEWKEQREETRKWWNLKERINKRWKRKGGEYYRREKTKI